MIIVMASRDKKDVDHVIEKVEAFGYRAHVIEGVERTVIAAVGDERGKERLAALESLAHVEKVVPILKPFKLAGLEVRQERSVVQCGNVKIGGGHFCIVGGPCSVESRDQIMETAKAVKDAGGNMLRGGAYKPRTSPYSFQGMEEQGLILLEEAGKTYGLPVVTEVMTIEQVPLVEKHADMFQIGARNMQNFGLLKAVGRSRKPVFLKRGMASTIQEFLMSAEYVMSEGNPNVVLCERGIRTFETETRNTLDIHAVPVLQKYTHLPVVVDPSHAAGRWDIIASMSRASVAAGADGLMIEVHPRPEEAFSDGPQSLRPAKFAALVKELQPFLELMGQKMG
ncbi:MAG: 3-deoxy-7-phosphoheptulonate synthase [Candidatus Hydrogenedentes bacterium]|nr:3-deoxy-7-phosphoheptulonate synthase [Candidatus Hydrogenedentota bacterium]